MPRVLRAHAVWKSYAAGVARCSARIWVLRGVSLDVEQGERIAVLGARGAGVTTLLHCLAGLRRPDAGRIDRARSPHVVSGASSRVTRAAWDAQWDEDLVLLDDDATSEDLVPRRELRAQRASRGALIIGTHELARVRLTVDRVLLLRHGRLSPLDRASGVRRVAESRMYHDDAHETEMQRNARGES
jgi:ABC-type multidrug transport system ATPase subunit